MPGAGPGACAQVVVRKHGKAGLGLSDETGSNTVPRSRSRPLGPRAWPRRSARRWPPAVRPGRCVRAVGGRRQGRNPKDGEVPAPFQLTPRLAAHSAATPRRRPGASRGKGERQGCSPPGALAPTKLGETPPSRVLPRENPNGEPAYQRPAPSRAGIPPSVSGSPTPKCPSIQRSPS